ncbi:MAG: bifunctional diaminohydroxyphosphoribosylaminopyrimidine deaminase/5-amino-6-(5-phosphoribosylamino)uracil reductase RibD [Pseudomonadota bacterium]
MDTADARWMRHALDLARRRLGDVSPNPAVGCVIVGDQKVLGRGATAIGGRPHAEVIALSEAERLWGPAATRGATAYVTLEPCAHHGQTPPCADALVAAGIARVVCPLEDPDPRVSGRGFARLIRAGIDVDIGCLAADAEAVNAGFLMRQRAGRPWVTLKMATTLDGRIATRTGESRWITGPDARARVHLMRARSDGVLIGAGTARIDDPRLDIRLPGTWRNPDRIVADGSLSLPLTGHLVAGAGASPVTVLHRAGAPDDRKTALASAGVKLIEVGDEGEGLLDMADALGKLAVQGMTRLLCEGGGRMAAALLRADLVDEIVLFTAGKIIGGDGLPVVQGFGLLDLADATMFHRASVAPIGDDTMSTWLKGKG